MNAEPPTARFQVEHQPRRPGYARRSPAFISQLRLSKFIKVLIVAFFDPLYSGIRVLLCGCLRLANITFDPARDSSLQAAFDSRFDSIQP